MENSSTEQTSGQATQPMANPKHMKSFWPLFIIVVVAFIAGGVIMYIISDAERQDDINSILFMKSKPSMHNDINSNMQK
jgi:hypothetical protein